MHALPAIARDATVFNDSYNLVAKVAFTVAEHRGTLALMSSRDVHLRMQRCQLRLHELARCRAACGIALQQVRFPSYCTGRAVTSLMWVSIKPTALVGLLKICFGRWS